MANYKVGFFSMYRSRSDKPVFFIKIRLAGLNIEIECSCGRGLDALKPYLADFDKPDFIVKPSKKEIIEAYNRVTNKPFKAISFDNTEVGSLELFVVHSEIINHLIFYNTLTMHGAVIAKNGRSYMFTAPSGTGKTTRAKLWIEEYPDSIVVNGDKPFIKITNNEAIACGSPWCGKEGLNTNIMIPLQAIFFLERANDNEKSTIKEISFYEAFPKLLQQSYIPSNPDAMHITIQLLKGLEGKVSFYQFYSTATRESIRLAFETAQPR